MDLVLLTSPLDLNSTSPSTSPASASSSSSSRSHSSGRLRVLSSRPQEQTRTLTFLVIIRFSLAAAARITGHWLLLPPSGLIHYSVVASTHFSTEHDPQFLSDYYWTENKGSLAPSISHEFYSQTGR
jgi:hypothetical protein